MIRIQKGFTLIELMVVVVIIGILAVVSYPSYVRYLQHGRRSDAQTSLLDVANRMDQYYTENNTYVISGATPLTTLNVNTTTPQGYYTLSLSNLTATTFTVTATPKSGTAQANDPCGNLTINELGQRAFTGTGVTQADCWQ